MAVAWQHPREDLQGQMMSYAAVERAPGEEGDARVPGSCWGTLWLTSPARRGAAALQFLEDMQACTLCEASTVPRDGAAGSAQHEPQHSPAAVPPRRRESPAGPAMRRAALLLHWHMPQEDPADNSCPLTVRRAGGSVSAPRLERGPRVVMLPGQEKEPPGLGTPVSPALQVLAQAQTPQASDQAKRVATAVPSVGNFRLSAYFKPLHQKPRLHLPSCTGCPALGLPRALAPRSLQPWAPERWGLARGALG